MIKIAICDSSDAARERTSSLIKKYAEEKDLFDEIELSCFTTSFDLLDVVEKGGVFDIFILETVMPGMNGIMVARELRKLNIESTIIFVTFEKSYALDAFEVGAAQYLLKGDNMERLYDVMDRALDVNGRERRRQVLLTTKEGLHNIYMRDIMYAESNRNYQILTLEDGRQLEVRITGKELATELEKNKSFKRCGSSYIVNWFFVRNMNPERIQMVNDMEIPIPRGQYHNLRQNCQEFYSLIS